MKKLYEGGQCNPNAMGTTSNHYKRAMNQMAFGNQNSERVLDHSHAGTNFQDEIIQRQQLFKNMNQNFMQAKQSFDKAQEEKFNSMMNRQYQLAKHNQQYQINRPMQMHKQQPRTIQNTSLNQPQFYPSQTLGMQNMMNVQLENLRFMEMDRHRQVMMMQDMQDLDLNIREEIFRNKQLRNKQTYKNLADQSSINNQILMENAWRQAEKKVQEKMKIPQPKLQNNQTKVQKALAQLMQKMQPLREQMPEEKFDQLVQQRYRQMLNGLGVDWSKIGHQHKKLNQYSFKEQNAYKHLYDPKSIAYELMNKGQNNLAIAALQAHLKKNIDDGQSWRILGKLLQQQDQDQQAKLCFMESLKKDPCNLDCLMSLGFSLSNSYDEIEALNCLKKWIQHNPKYQYLNIDPNIIRDNNTSIYNYSNEQFNQIKQKMLQIFHSALKKQQGDSELWSALGLLNIVNKNYKHAVQCFNKVLHFDPNNYFALNRLASCLGSMGRIQQATQMSHRALQIRPNYVRVWSNLAKLHKQQELYDEATRFYLNALSLRPQAKHLWDSLRTMFIREQRYDLLKLAEAEDLRLFKQFDILNIQELPQPAIPYKITNQRYIIGKPGEQWLKIKQSK